MTLSTERNLSWSLATWTQSLCLQLGDLENYPLVFIFIFFKTELMAPPRAIAGSNLVLQRKSVEIAWHKRSTPKMLAAIVHALTISFSWYEASDKFWALFYEHNLCPSFSSLPVHGLIKYISISVSTCIFCQYVTQYLLLYNIVWRRCVQTTGFPQNYLVVQTHMQKQRTFIQTQAWILHVCSM